MAQDRGRSGKRERSGPTSVHIQQLLHLREVARQGNVTRAAAALGLTQPALSSSLGQLERRLGITLFERSGRKRVLTQDGHAALDFAERVLSEADELERRIDPSGGAEVGTLAVGAFDAASLYVLPNVVRTYRHAHPNVDLTLAVDSSSQLLARLRAFELDVAFVIGPVDDDLSAVEVGREPLHVYAPQGPWQALEDADWVLYPAGSRMRRIIDEGLARLGVSPHVRLESGNPDVLRQMMSLGVGWTVLPVAVAERDRASSLEYTRRAQVGEMTVVAAQRGGARRNPRADAFVELALEGASSGSAAEGRAQPTPAESASRTRVVKPRRGRASFTGRLRAARRFETSELWQQAAGSYGECLSLVEQRDSSQPDALDLNLAQGCCLRNVGEWRPAWQALARAFDEARERRSGTAMARVALEISEMSVPMQRVLPLIDEALAAIGDEDPPLRARLIAARLSRDNGVDDARHADEAASIARELELDDVELQLAASVREAEQLVGDAPAIAHRRRAAAHALAGTGRLATAARLLLEAGAVLLWEGRITEGEQALGEALEFARSHHLRFYELRVLSNLASLAFARCDFQTLDSIIKELHGQEGSVREAARWELVGELDRALALLPTPDDAGHIAAFLMSIHGARARVLHSAGRLDEARREVAHWHRAFDAQGAMSRGAISATNGLAEIDVTVAALGDDAACREFYAELEARNAQRFGGRGLDLIRGSLAERFDRENEAAAHYQTGAAWAHESGFPVDEARCLAALARLWQRIGKHAEAERLRLRARELLGEVDAAVYSQRIDDEVLATAT